MDQPSKRAFLRGRFISRDTLRPPGSIGAFEDICTRCDACLEACPTDIIVKGQSGYPELSFDQGECLFCSDCAKVCEAEAIRPATQWHMRAKVNSSCLSYNGVTCRACEDQCEQQAIRFRLITGGKSLPAFDLEACTGCGACIAPCPTQSIQLFQHMSTSGDGSC